MGASCGSKKELSKKDRARQVRLARESSAKTDKDKRLIKPEEEQFQHFEISSPSDYIKTFSSLAQDEMLAFGIPASITLAQGLLESGFGKGELALKTNNHFGIKCHKGWQGDYDFHDDDAKGECFRKYNHPRYSYRDHSLFLTTRSRYAFLFDLRPTDYVAWAKGLKKAGYATDKKYPQKLIYLIEKYDLKQYDKRKGGKWVSEDKSGHREYHVVQKGDTLYSLSKKYYTTVSDLMRLNKLRNEHLSVGQRLAVK